jgi:hypothetical protein
MANTGPITIKTADELSMLALLTQNKLLRIGENAWQPAYGVGFSIVGQASLQSDEDRVPLAGFFLTIWVDLDEFTPAGTTAAAVWAILDGPTYKWAGDPIRQVAGIGDFRADVVTRALAYAKTRKTSFRTPGTPINWYPFELRSGAQLSVRLQRLANLATDADVAAADISIPRLNRVREAITTKAQAAAILAALNDADIKWDKALWRLESAVEADPAYDWTTHNYPNGYNV